METEGGSSKPEALELRTRRFAKEVRAFVRGLPKTICNLEDARQFVRSSGSVAANYIEANEAISPKDFVLRIKYCRKEAKESHLWLDLLELGGCERLEKMRRELLQEATELKLIFSAILRKVE